MEAPPSPRDGLSEIALSRRTFLRSSLMASAGLTGILLTKTPPAFAQERELKLLTFAHFVPASDDELRRQLEEFGKQAGVKVRMDQVAHLQLPAVLASEVQGQKGHDILGLSRFAMPNLYAKHLVKLDDLVEKMGRENGGWINKEVGKGGDGQYHGVPWFYVSLPMAVRTDLLAEVGEELPDTWEDVRRIGQKLKAKGHPLGIAYSHCEDSNNTLRGIIWSFGGKEVEKDGKTVVLNSKETVEAYKFMKALYEDAMDGDVLAWDDRNNGFVLPAVIIMTALIVYPFFLALWFSLSDGMIGETRHWIGLKNFAYILQDHIFLQTIRNTIIFAVSSVVLKSVFGLALALLLQRATRWKRFFRGSVLIPFVAPTALTTLGWWLIFDPTYSHINWALKHIWPLNLLGLGPYQWLGQEYLALAACAFVNFWRGLPFFAVTIFAGLVAIPAQIYEAAETDGASAWRKFWHITLPLLRPVLAVVTLFSTIFTLGDFNIVYVLTRGGPMNSTHLFATYSFTEGILNHDIGLGAAIALFLFPLLFVIVILQLRMVRKETSYGL